MQNELSATNSLLMKEFGGTARPRLLFVVNVDWFFMSHRLPIAKAALSKGYDVHLACGITSLKDEIQTLGIQVHELKLHRSDVSPISIVGSVFQLVVLFLALRPSIVHLVTIKPVLLGGIAARLTRTRRVITAISGLGYIFTAKGNFARLRRVVVRVLYMAALRSKHVTAIFQNFADANLVSKYAGLKKNQIVMIKGSGVDLEKFRPQPLPEGDTVVTFAARLLVDKGIREFVEAAYVLRGEGIKARFLIAGSLDQENPASILPSELKSWCDDGVVELIGHQCNINQLFAASHIIVLPSYREGLPKVVIEAAACGRAVITTDVPGCRDAVISGKTALLVPAAVVAPLAHAMRTLIEDRTRCAAMGAAGRTLAEEKFDVRHVIDAHLSLYARLLALPT